MARDDPQIKLRLPAALKAQVERAATVANRSLNAEIVHRLMMSFPPVGTRRLVVDHAGRLGMVKTEPPAPVDAATVARLDEVIEIIQQIRDGFDDDLAGSG